MEGVTTIKSIQQISPTVKVFEFDLAGVELDFLPGQWVDLYVDTGLSVQVGGYSIISTPLQQGIIELAIKRLPHGRVAACLHDHAKVGDEVELRGGSGGFHFEPEWHGPLVLIAGGIGITPLISILRYVDQSHLENPVELTYSASQATELLFREEIQAIADRNTGIRCAFTVSGRQEGAWGGRVGRIDLELLREHAPTQDSLYYLCGPPAFQDDLSVMVSNLGVEDSMIRAERWW